MLNETFSMLFKHWKIKTGSVFEVLLFDGRYTHLRVNAVEDKEDERFYVARLPTEGRLVGFALRFHSRRKLSTGARASLLLADLGSTEGNQPRRLTRVHYTRFLKISQNISESAARQRNFFSYS